MSPNKALLTGTCWPLALVLVGASSLAFGGCRGSISGDQAAQSGGGQAAAAGGASSAAGMAAAGNATSTDGTLPTSSEQACSDNSVGRLPARLLTGQELVSVAEQAFGLGLDVPKLAATFPDAVETAGFKNNGNVVMNDFYLEKALDAAETIAGRVVQALPKLLPCQDTRGCASTFVTKYARRIYRRTPSQDEVAALLDMFDQGKDFASGIKLVTESLLMSAAAEYQVEIGTPTAEGQQLTGVEVASKLSFFLWHQGPDDQLLGDAEAGVLDTDAGVAQAVMRMLGDARSRDALGTFVRGWLDLDSLGSEVVLGDGTPSRAALLDENDAFFRSVVFDGDGLLGTLLTSDQPFVDPTLAQFYAAGPRSGLLTQPAFLARYAHANQTAVVLRGQAVRNALFCELVPPPPNAGDADPARLDLSLPVRERYRVHDEDAACKGCHTFMDPLGLGFENYDQLGRYRTEDEFGAVDPTGDVVPLAEASSSVAGPFVGITGAEGLATRLRDAPAVRGCLTRTLLRYALMRDDGADNCAVSSAFEAFNAASGNVRDLLSAVTQTRSFRYRAVPQ